MKLQEWIKKECKNIKAWCQSIGIAPATYHSIVHGRDIKLSIALKIQRATKGQVKCEDMEPVSMQSGNEAEEVELRN